MRAARRGLRRPAAGDGGLRPRAARAAIRCVARQAAARLLRQSGQRPLPAGPVRRGPPAAVSPRRARAARSRPPGAGCGVPPGSSSRAIPGGTGSRRLQHRHGCVGAGARTSGHRAAGCAARAAVLGREACRDFDEYHAVCRRTPRAEGDDLRDSRNAHRRRRVLASPRCSAMAAGSRCGRCSAAVACRFAGRAFARPLREFARRWPARGAPSPRFRIVLSGEIYMRITQAEDVFRLLLAHLVSADSSSSTRRHGATSNTCSMKATRSPGTASSGSTRRIRATARNAAPRRTASAGASGATKASAFCCARCSPVRSIVRRARAAPVDARRARDRARDPADAAPAGEILTYTGETLSELRHGADLVLNVAPNGCMVSSMGELLTPSIAAAPGVGQAQIQSLFSADGEVDEELLTLAAAEGDGPRALLHRRRGDRVRPGAAAARPLRRRPAPAAGGRVLRAIRPRRRTAARADRVGRRSRRRPRPPRPRAGEGLRPHAHGHHAAHRKRPQRAPAPARRLPCPRRIGCGVDLRALHRPRGNRRHGPAHARPAGRPRQSVDLAPRLRARPAHRIGPQGGRFVDSDFYFEDLRDRKVGADRHRIVGRDLVDGVALRCARKCPRRSPDLDLHEAGQLDRRVAPSFRGASTCTRSATTVRASACRSRGRRRSTAAGSRSTAR